MKPHGGYKRMRPWTRCACCRPWSTKQLNRTGAKAAWRRDVAEAVTISARSGEELLRRLDNPRSTPALREMMRRK